MKKIVHNRAKCLMCGDVIESRHRDEFRLCSCGNLRVSGGKDYVSHIAHNGAESFLDLVEYAKYAWDAGGAYTSEDQLWVCGVDLLSCPKSDTGEQATLSVSLPFIKHPMAVDCRIYAIPASLFSATVPIRQVYIALCKLGHTRILFRDTVTFGAVEHHVGHLSRTGQTPE